MQAEVSAARAFLDTWRPGGPWALVAIRPDKQSMKSWVGVNLDDCVDWLNTVVKTHNCYFHVNPLTDEYVLDSKRKHKAERKHVQFMDWLHVDIDCRVGEDHATELKRIEDLLTAGLPSGLPPPTTVVFSGGGYQGFWRLDTPVIVDGSVKLADELALYNLQIEILLGGDHCHDLSRVMRLPGTVNWPDAKKAARGRVPVLAAVSGGCGASYPLAAFQKAVLRALEGAGDSSRAHVQISDAVARVTDLDVLSKWSVDVRTRVIIAQGMHPEETKGEGRDRSRSGWLFDCLCQLYRCGVPDDVIYSIITDKEWGISASVLDKGSNVRRYAMRQMARAKEEVEEPWLRRLNDRHAVIGNLGGRCRVIEEVSDPAFGGRLRLTRQTFDDFRNRYMNKSVQVGRQDDGRPIYQPVGKWWLNNPHRRQYDTMVFAPAGEVNGSYNLWRGFAVERGGGGCGLYLDHLRRNICGEDQDKYDYLLRWMARCVQSPASPGEVAIVLKGGRGVGKGKMAKVFGALFGRHFLHISQSSHLVGNFNAHLRDCVVLFADEAFFAGDKKHRSVLNALITEESITIEAKGVDAEACPNFIHLIMASNDDYVIPAGLDERRYFVLDVRDDNKQDKKFFGDLDREMEGGGFGGLLNHLMTVDLTGFEVRDVPRTDGLVMQKLYSMTTEEEWWYSKLCEGRVGLDDEWPGLVRCDEVTDDYFNYMRKTNATRRSNATVIGLFMRRAAPGIRRVRRLGAWSELDVSGHAYKREGRVYYWELPKLSTCRQFWEQQLGRKVDWDDD